MISKPRRRLMQLLGLGGAASLLAAGESRAADTRAAAPGMLPAPADSSFALVRGKDGLTRLTVDMAVLGHTDAPDPSGRIGDPRSQDYFRIDSRGDSYYVEGLLYPGGTLPAPTRPTGLPVFKNAPPKLNNEVVWDFKAAQPTGRWLNRGWVLINGSPEPYRDSAGTEIDRARREPHLLSEHTFVLGSFGAKTLSPEMLITSGVENGNDPDDETIIRAVIGGTGRFRHASGQVVQTRVGRNTSILRSFSQLGNVASPNYRFEFELRLA